MRITKEILTKTTEEAIGEDAIPLVFKLKGRENISEFKLADELKVDVHLVRNILYRLNNFHLATYMRKKDRQKGWYISYWTFNRRRVNELIDRLKREKLEKLKDQLKKEESNKDNFFICSKACARLDFDQATEFEFKCPECGSLLLQQENAKTIDNIRKRIREIESAS